MRLKKLMKSIDYIRVNYENHWYFVFHSSRELLDHILRANDIEDQMKVLFDRLLLKDSDLEKRNKLKDYLQEVLDSNGFECSLYFSVRLLMIWVFVPQIYLSVLNMHNSSCNLENLWKYQLRALFKSQHEKSPNIELLLVDLYLTLDWNCSLVGKMRSFLMFITIFLWFPKDFRLY